MTSGEDLRFCVKIWHILHPHTTWIITAQKYVLNSVLPVLKAWNLISISFLVCHILKHFLM